MTQENALKMASDFRDIVMGKPISELFPGFNIIGIDIEEGQENHFEPNLYSESKTEPGGRKYFLINHLIEYNIPFDRQEYGLPAQSES